MSMSDQVDWKKLFPEEQQVPSGNPIVEYLDQRAKDYGEKSAKAMQGAGAYGIGALALGGLTTPGSLGMGALSINELLKALAARGRMKWAEEGSDMWANRFGANDGQQGLPGTPAGPAWRK